VAEGRDRHPQQLREGGREDGGAKIVNQITLVITTPKALSLARLSPSCNSSGTLNQRPSSLLYPGSCEANTLKGVTDRWRRRGEENRLRPEREEADRRSQRRRDDESYYKRAAFHAYSIERETRP
jgi:hypothetical protein